MTGRKRIGVTWTNAQGRSHLLHLESWKVKEPLSELESYTRIGRDPRRDHSSQRAQLAQATGDEPKKGRMKAPFFSVLIDTCNYGEFIEEAVSVRWRRIFSCGARILVVDDGSTDDTQERLRKFGEALRYLRKPNGGQASAFNSGARQSAPMRLGI